MGKKYLCLEMAKMLFYMVVPIVIFALKCTDIAQVEGGTKFIIGCSGYIAAIILFVVMKKFVFKRFLEGLQGRLINYSTQLATETDEGKIELIEAELHKAKTINSCITVIPTILVLGLLLLLVKAIETDLITLYAVIGLSTISFVFGFICEIWQDLSIKSKNRKKEEETE